MKHSSHFLLLLLTLLSTLAIAQAPRTMNYQGFLTTDGVTPIADGTYDITFTIYDAPSAGTNLWSENHGALQVTNGDFAVVLGLGTPLNLGFDIQLWMGITVAPDPEMTPRVEMTASPYAMGLDTQSSIIIGSTGNPSVPGEIRFNGSSFEGFDGGAWNSFDAAAPPSPFLMPVSDDGNNVTFGLPTPIAGGGLNNLSLVSDGGQSGIASISFGADPFMVNVRLNGSVISPSPLIALDYIGGYVFAGSTDNAGATNIVSYMTSFATENYTGIATGSALVFGTTANGSNVLTNRMIIDNNGYVGINAIVPAAWLHVSADDATVPLIVDNNGAAPNIVEFQNASSIMATIDSAGKGTFNGGLATIGLDNTGTTVHSGTVVLTSGIAIDPTGITTIQLDGGTATTINAGVEGQILYILNNSGSAPLIASVSIPANTVGAFIYINGAWRKMD